MGQLALDATLTDLLPEAITVHIANASMIDVRMLLSHRSGIADCVTDELIGLASAEPAHVWTLDEFLTAVEEQEPTGAPDAGYSYSNTNYVLLGEILRAQTGQDWRDVVTENVIERAGMTQSSLPLPDNREMPAPIVRGYIDFPPDESRREYPGRDRRVRFASCSRSEIEVIIKGPRRCRCRRFG